MSLVVSQAPTRARAWCYTVYARENVDENLVTKASCEIILKKIIEKSRYICWQVETCPTTQRLHIQAWSYFEAPIGLAGLKKLHPTASFRACKGSAAENDTYCSKPGAEHGPYKQGSPPAPGKRSDIDAAVEDIRAGKKMRVIAAEHSSAYVRYHRGFTALRSILTPPRSHVTETVIYWGPPGSYKTSHALEMAGPDAYVLTRALAGTGAVAWWDGYDNHEDVVIDEFYSWLPFNIFLNLLDKIPLMVQTKGGSTQFTAKRIWITSNQNPKDWYSTISDSLLSARPALLRRLSPPMTQTFFMGYGPNMDLEFCPCAFPNLEKNHPDFCPLVHKQPNGPAALAPGLVMPLENPLGFGLAPL